MLHEIKEKQFVLLFSWRCNLQCPFTNTLSHILIAEIYTGAYYVANFPRLDQLL